MAASCLLLLGLLGQADASHDSIVVPDGFHVTLFADDDLAHNIYSMTLDARGRVAVSGPGYVRMLEDQDGDGRADTTWIFADGPKTGAQGLCFDGNDLLCVGDEGLLRYRDQDADGRADGPPELLLAIRCGGEHHAHAVRKGADGWWYVIAGNDTGVDQRYATLPTSPLVRPSAGTVLRLAPDGGSEILADGFRNAYDFDFGPSGDLYTFDSDGERDVSLPWYRPTRVFQVVSGSHAGWESRGWKMPDDYPEMPPTVASFGRGSPTGVVCYRHVAFPEPYRGALFVCDWTFGRVLALPLDESRAAATSSSILFMRGSGHFGFAPTDVEVGPDGALWVSVGGRGTRGGVYRVTTDTTPTESRSLAGVREARPERVRWQACLAAPQPLSAWSRAQWVPEARALGEASLTRAALDGTLPANQRARAVEILVELYEGVPEDAMRPLADTADPIVRARTAWALGRRQPALTPGACETLVTLMGDENDRVARCAFEATLGRARDDELARHVTRFPRISHRHPLVRAAALRLYSRLSPTLRMRWDTGEDVTVSSAWRDRGEPALVRTELAWPLAERFTREPRASERLWLLRMIQHALGDAGPSGGPMVFDGYRPRIPLPPLDEEYQELAELLAPSFPTGEARVDRELSRTLAMLAPEGPQLLDAWLSRMSNETSPVTDVHFLIVAARTSGPRSDAQRQELVARLLDLDRKLARDGLPRDRNWDPRLQELVARMQQLDERTAGALVVAPAFGRPGHVPLARSLPPAHRQAALDRIAERLQTDRSLGWTADAVLLIGQADSNRWRPLLRDLLAVDSLRPAALTVMARHPDAVDSDQFVRGLSSHSLEVVEACVSALEQLPAREDGAAIVTLYRTARRMGNEAGETALRDRLVELLQRSTGCRFELQAEGDEPGSQTENWNAWEAFLAQQFPAEREIQAASTTDQSAWREVLASVDWESGDLERGAELYRQRTCFQCHGSRRALGPDLSGITRRFSREDLFRAILDPHRDVSPRYQTTVIYTTRGQSYSGVIIYDSVDGVTLRDGLNRTVRIPASDIDERSSSARSLMPTGLLDGMTPADLADLYRYLQSLDR